MAKSTADLCRNPEQLRKYLAKQPFKNKQLAFDAFCSLAKDPLSFDAFAQIFDPLLKALAGSPDPDMALNNLERFTSAIFSCSTLYGFLRSAPPLMDLLVKLFGTSQFLSDALIRNPEYLDWLADESVLGARKGKDDFFKELNQTLKLFPKKESKMHVLRRFKRREMLRIGARDILGNAPLEITVEELSALADALMEIAVGLAMSDCVAKYGIPQDISGGKQVPARFCVIGMGKLGGMELNYSSDIDVMFVYSGEGAVQGGKAKANAMSTHEFFNKICEQVIQIIADTTKEGYVFRVDTRLRPEGETGPLSRSLESYETYYATWGEPWEKLALIKARPIAGDAALGKEFIAMTRPFVYQKYLGPAAIEEIRHIRRRIEVRLTTQKATFTEVKLGYGGIREIEFPIQLLQLIHGARVSALQGNNSLETIEALDKAKLLHKNERESLAEAYRFLRRVEHFLQIVHELQVHRLPSDPEELEKLAKRIGFCDTGKHSALECFNEDYRRHTQNVHTFYARIFLEDGAEENSCDLGFLFQKGDEAKAVAYLSTLGFKDPDKARNILLLLANGPDYMHLSAATVREFVDLTPNLLQLLKESPDPDLALNEFERIVSAQGARATFYKLLHENERLMELLIVTAGNSPDLAEDLVRNPEFLELLTRDAFLHQPKTHRDLKKDLATWLEKFPEGGEKSRRMKLFKEYEMLRIGVRDLLKLADLPMVLSELSDVADVLAQHVLQGLTSRIKKKLPYALFALGKWGSRELGYYSDLDAIFVYDGPAEDTRAYQGVFQHFMQGLTENKGHGCLYKVDVRLRPGGKSDVLVLPLDGYHDYYATKLQTWEMQMLTRLRFIAGDADFGQVFQRMVESFIYRRGLTSTQVGDIRVMRERMTKEKVFLRQKGSHVKLGVGGIVDVEFSVQLLQLHWGWKFPALRHGAMWEILHRAEENGLLSWEERETLSAGYLFLRAIENKLRMVSGLSIETIPKEMDHQYRLVQRLGFSGSDRDTVVENFWKRYRDTTAAIRAVFESLCAKSGQ